MSEVYIEVNALGMSFGRDAHRGGKYPMGSVVRLSELRDFGYHNDSFQEHLISGVVKKVSQKEYNEFIGETETAEDILEEAAKEVEEVAAVETVDEASEEEEEGDFKEDEYYREKSGDLLLEETRDGMNLEQYWDKHQKDCPVCHRKHRAKLDLFHCEE